MAISLVVLNHSIAMTLEAGRHAGLIELPAFERYILAGLQQLGLIAVPTFLFVSGAFSVFAAYNGDMRAAYRAVRSGLRNIIGPYVIWSAIFYLMEFLLLGQSLTAPQYVKSLIVGYPYHFVPLFVFFYASGPILVAACRRYPWHVVLAVGAYQLFDSNIVTPGLLGVSFPEWMRYGTPPVLRTTIGEWAIYYPLGILCSLYGDAVRRVTVRLWPALVTAGVLLYAVYVVTTLRGVNLGLAGLLCPVPIVLTYPLLKRDRLPFVHLFERLGERAYGLYLVNLLALNVALMAVVTMAPAALTKPLLLVPALWAFTAAVGHGASVLVRAVPQRHIRRYVFG